MRWIIKIGCHVICQFKHQPVNICSEWQLVRVYMWWVMLCVEVVRVSNRK